MNTPKSISSYFGIVSPCSTCANKRLSPDPNTGLSGCPRRAAQNLQSQLQSAGLTTIQVDPLALTGNEDTSDSSSTSLVNPVYSSQLNSVLVWVATLSDNSPTYDSSGNVINPDLLDPSFDTKYIRCREKPVSPADNEAVYRSKGAWAEGDQLHINIVNSQQIIPQDTKGTPVLLNGFANKVNFSYSAPRTSQDRDYSVSGT